MLKHDCFALAFTAGGFCTWRDVLYSSIQPLLNKPLRMKKFP